MTQTSGRKVAAIVFVALLIIGGLIGIIIWQTQVVNDRERQANKAESQSPWGGLAGLTFMAQNKKAVLVIDDLLSEQEGKALTINMAETFAGSEPENCDGPSSKDDSVCQEWSDQATLTISFEKEKDISCYNFTWKATKCVSQVLKDCIHMEDAHWYGGAQDWYQYWPLELWNRELSPYVAGDSYARQIGGVMERYFFNSKGFAVFIEKEVPLHVSINHNGDQKLCLVSRYAEPYNNYDQSLPHLEYTVCTSKNAKTIHQYMSSKFFSRATEIPDERLFTSPIWSTWAQFKKDINQSTVIQFADDILANKFPHSQLEIDDDWTVHYGDMDFNRDKFPDPKAMVEQLTERGFRTTIWVHTFANIDSNAFLEGAKKKYWVTEPRGKIPALVSWWRGEASAILDVTNRDAFNWYLEDLKYLRDNYNISSFKFDAGEVPWLPAAYKTNQTFRNPDDYTTLWAELAYEADKDIRHQEVRVGSRTQHLPIFVRMLDRDSKWDYNNGLKTLIPVSFTFGLLGYPFILPDMIGGNAYNGSLEGRVYPEKELFIRWLQLNAFLPAMQFSIVPWNYDEEVINISRKFVQLHQDYASKIISLAREHATTGAPIIRPLWWIAPEDDAAQTIDTQFLLGDDILVAPILESGARNRNIYLPAGQWKDNLRNETLSGGRWINNYAVALDELAFFTKV